MEQHKVEFTPEQYKIIHQAVRYYQIHGASFNSKEYKICDEVLNMTFGKYYTQRREQER